MHDDLTATPFIRLRGVSKAYGTAERRFTALCDLSLDIGRSESVAVVGRSGSGKTTLINLLTGIDTPSAGEIVIGGQSIHLMTQEQLAQWRGRNVGIVFQFFQLLPTLTVAENIMLPMDFCDTYPSSQRRPRALKLLDQLGIAEQADKVPADLSGGQQQRAAIARALANDPPLLVADEPTGNLDSATGEEIMRVLDRLHAAGHTIILVTHERDIAAHAHRVLHIRDGKIASDERMKR